MRPKTIAFMLSRRLGPAVGVAIGLVCLFLISITASRSSVNASGFPVASQNGCFSVVTSTLSSGSNGWMINLTVKGDLPHKAVFSVQPESFSSQPVTTIAVLPTTPSEIRLVFDMDNQLVAPRYGNEEEAGEEDAFWNDYLPDLLHSSIKDIIDVPRASLSAYPVTGGTPLEWQSADNRPFTVTFENILRQAVSCAARSELSGPVNLKDLRDTEREAGSRRWIIVRWQPSDDELFRTRLDSPKIAKVAKDLLKTYGLDLKPIPDDIIAVVLLQRRAFTSEGLAQADLQNNIGDLETEIRKADYGKRVSLAVLTVDNKDHNAYKADEESLRRDLLISTEMHLSFLWQGKLLTKRQLEKNHFSLSYTDGSSDTCSKDSATEVPFPFDSGRWNGAKADDSSLTLMPWAVAACVILAFGLWLSLFLFRRNTWEFRSHLVGAEPGGLGFVFPWYYEYNKE